MGSIFDLAAANLLSPMVLFFVLGLMATLAKSDLSIPEAIAIPMQRGNATKNTTEAMGTENLARSSGSAKIITNPARRIRPHSNFPPHGGRVINRWLKIFSM